MSDLKLDQELKKIKDVLSRDRMLNGKEWHLVCQSAKKLIPSQWFILVCFDGQRWLSPFIYVHGIEKKERAKMYRLTLKYPDLTASVALFRGIPTRLCDFVNDLSRHPDNLVCSLFEKSRLFQDVLSPGGVYYFLRVPLFDGNEPIGQFTAVTAVLNRTAVIIQIVVMRSQGESNPCFRIESPAS